MGRRTDLAGKSVKQGGYTVSYDENGYAKSSTHDNGASATSTVKTTKANDSSTSQAMYQAAQSGNWDEVGRLSNSLLGTNKDASGGYDTAATRDYLKELQNEFGYNTNDYLAKKVSDWNTDRTNSGANATDSGAVGASGYGSGGYGSFQDYLSDMGYDDYTEQTRKYIQAAIDNAVNGYESQIEDVNSSTKELARQAYISKMLGEKNLDQQLAASGIAGGMADSQRIGLEANYENELAELERQRADTVKELELAIENARLTGDMQTAQELSSYLQQVQSQWSSYVQNQKQMENQNYWNQLNAETDAANTARNWALTLLESGSMPDDATLTAAGISKVEANSLLNQVLKSQKVKSDSSAAVEDTLISAISAYSQLGSQSLSENQVRALWNAGERFEEYADVIPALAQYLGVTNNSSSTGMIESHFNAYGKAIMSQLASGRASAALDSVTAIWNQLSDEQRQTLQTALGNYGLAYKP